MWLSPRLAWKRWRLRNQPVRLEGRPLSEREQFGLEVARFALLDEEGTRQAAVDGEGAVLTARAVLGTVQS